MTPSDPTRDPDQHPTLADHERHLVEFGRYMLARDRTPDNTDWAIVGRLAAFVINGIPAVRAALTPPPSLDVERLARAMGSTGNCGHSSCPRDTSRHDDEAREVAAEYAALSRPGPSRPEWTKAAHLFTAGPVPDECADCGLDIRDVRHVRWSTEPSE